HHDARFGFTSLSQKRENLYICGKVSISLMMAEVRILVATHEKYLFRSLYFIQAAGLVYH
ncbi:MAG: hypothetical protein IJ322_06090, partial [Clostridia bacterium]|nr:hypothetical protein [Clostridia bacterium]